MKNIVYISIIIMAIMWVPKSHAIILQSCDAVCAIGTAEAEAAYGNNSGVVIESCTVTDNLSTDPTWDLWNAEVWIQAPPGTRWKSYPSSDACGYRLDDQQACEYGWNPPPNAGCNPPPIVCTAGQTGVSTFTEAEWAKLSVSGGVDTSGCAVNYEGSPSLYNDAQGNILVGIDTVQTGEVGSPGAGQATDPPADIGDISGSTIPDISINDTMFQDSAPYTDANGDYVEQSTKTETETFPGGTTAVTDGTETTVTRNPDGSSTTKTTVTETVTHADGTSTVTTTTTQTTTTNDSRETTFGPDGGYADNVIPGGTTTDGTKEQIDEYDANGDPTSSSITTEGQDPDEEEEEQPEETILSEAPTDGDTIQESLGRLMSGIYDSEIYSLMQSASFPTSSGSCPDFTVPMFNTNVSTTNHCLLFEQIGSILGFVFLAGWSVAGLRILMSA